MKDITWIYRLLGVSLLRDMTDIIRSIRKIVIDSIHAQKLTDVMYGTVISASPVKIQIEQKLILDENHLKLTRSVRDYETEISINNGPKQQCKIFNGLKKGDIVTLIRAHGGQQYIVIDKEG